MNHKFKKFLDVAGKALLPEKPKSTDWAPGILGLAGMVLLPFPGPKKLLIPAYIALGVAAIPVMATYYAGKAGYKKINKNYMTLERVEKLFPTIYKNKDLVQFNQMISKIQYKGNVDIYDFIISHICDNTIKSREDKDKEFIKGMFQNGKINKQDYSYFVMNTLVTVCASNKKELMKYILKNEGIKEYAKTKGFSYSLDKIELRHRVLSDRHMTSNSAYSYLESLSQKDLMFNTDSEPKRKPKM